MISPETISRHLKEYLPRVTNMFCEKTDVLAQIIAGTPQKLQVIYPSNGLIEGEEVVFTDVLIDNSITAVQEFTEPLTGDKVLRFTTEKGHDLTENYTQSVELAGFSDVGLNGSFPLYTVIDGNNFEILYPVLPTLSGNEVLREKWDNGINGIFSVSSIIDADTFEVELIGKPEWCELTLPSCKIAHSFRISTAASFDRAQQVYTKQETQDNWLFVIMEEMVVSKDRTVQSDATVTNTEQNPQRIRTINQFTVDVFIDTTEDLAGSDAVQLCWSDIFVYLLQTLQGVRFEEFSESNFVTSIIGHGSLLYNNAFYGHGYTFEYVYDITDAQAFTQNFISSRALRDVGVSLGNITGEVSP